MKQHGLILFILSWEIFVTKVIAKSTQWMEDMGHDACVMVGYHNKVSVFIQNMQYYPKWKTLLAMWHNLREISLHVLS
jgi:hypothetical protein